MPSAVQHGVVNIEKVRSKHSGGLAITGRFCSHPLYNLPRSMTKTFFDKFPPCKKVKKQQVRNAGSAETKVWKCKCVN